MKHTIYVKMEYLTPEFVVYAMNAERGFASSLEDPELGPEQEW
jgi:hypothetical protein